MKVRHSRKTVSNAKLFGSVSWHDYRTIRRKKWADELLKLATPTANIALHSVAYSLRSQN